MTTAELNLTATYVTALASEANATEKIKMLLQSLFSSYGKGADFPAQETEKVKAVSSIITFSQKELSKMDKTFRKEFIANGMVAHVIKRKRGKNAYIYEIRYRRNGFCIRSCSADFEEAKRK